MTKIIISAAEVSGDNLGAHLAAALKSIEPDIVLLGMGGEKMAAAGVDVRIDVTEKSSIGITEAFRHIPSQVFANLKMKSLLKKERPDAIVLIDAQGFNIPLAKKAKKLGIKTIYFVPPHYGIWGNKKSAKDILRFLNKIIAIFEEEAEVYIKAGGNVSYFGHPLVDIAKPSADKEDIIKKLGLDPNTKIIGLFPGSRRQEIKNFLPIMLSAVKIIDDSIGGGQFLLPIASSKLKKDFDKILKGSKANIKVLEGMNYDVLKVSDVAIASGGSVTLEAALIGTPIVMFYKLSKLTEFIVKKIMKIKVPFFSMPSLLLNKEVIPELVQKDATPENLAEEAMTLLTNDKLIDRMKEDFAAIRTKLGSSGVIGKVAQAVLELTK